MKKDFADRLTSVAATTLDLERVMAGLPSA